MAKNPKKRTIRNFDHYREIGTIRPLQRLERSEFLDFHKVAYEDDHSIAQLLVTGSPRWSVISGYYAMHDITKLYLAGKHGLKLSGREVHRATVEALKKVLEHPEERKKALRLLEKAEKLKRAQEAPSKDALLPELLKHGKKERGKTQYYSAGYDEMDREKAEEFMEEVVGPYLGIMKKLLG